jgi:hypothetical protein
LKSSAPYGTRLEQSSHLQSWQVRASVELETALNRESPRVQNPLILAFVCIDSRMVIVNHSFFDCHLGGRNCVVNVAELDPKPVP